MPTVVVRPAEKNDIPRIIEMIRRMAEYEKLTHQLEVDENSLNTNLFSENPVPRALVAIVESKVIGYAIYFFNYSTFIGKKGLYLEDLYVDTEYRGRGIGNSLFRRIAEIARREKCVRMDWVALNWNKPAIDFYESRGAKKLDEWLLFRFSQSELEALADTKI